MLGQIVAVTITVASLSQMESAYTDYLGYETIERGQVSAVTAQSWDAPAVAGHDYILMQPESGAPHYFRFVETEPYPDYQTIKSYGWNAAELLVTDTDAVWEKLKDSPFKVVGEPRYLSTGRTTKAMQVVGPARELLYLTSFEAGSSRMGQAESFVDRVFIVINGGADLDGLSTFFREKMGNEVSDPFLIRLSVLNRMYGIDVETQHPIAMTTLKGPFGVELDQYPAEATMRTARPGDLPPGISMVSFEVDDLDQISAPLLSAPVVLPEAPYNGRRSAIAKGPSGELFELIELKNH